jgi:uncharacterized protein (DUF2141 family)
MKKSIIAITLLSVLVSLYSFTTTEENYSLTIKVNDLKNAIGVVQFSIYNKDKTIPDEKHENFYLQKTATIKGGQASVTFFNLPEGEYAINILHDENQNKQIDKGWILPIEGIGFSNFNSIGFSNRPSFKKAKFNLNSNMVKTIKVIYM